VTETVQLGRLRRLQTGRQAVHTRVCLVCCDVSAAGQPVWSCLNRACLFGQAVVLTINYVYAAPTKAVEPQRLETSAPRRTYSGSQR
jgi:hypothetical protein